MEGTVNSKAGTIDGIITSLIDLVHKEKYSQNTINRLSSVWNKYSAYCEKQNITTPSEENVDAFIMDHYGCSLGDKCTSTHISRPMNMLLDYFHFGTIFKNSHVTLKGFSPFYASLFDGFLDYMKGRGFSEASIITWKSRLFRFEHFLLERGINSYREISIRDMNLYVESLAGYSSGYIAATVHTLSRLSDYAVENGYRDSTLSGSMPIVRKKLQYRLPYVFSDEEVERILKAIDRGNPFGKRLYAMTLLAAVYGLRIGDIRRLKFSSLDWTQKTITIITHKTGSPLVLELRDDIGWAIIDYLKNGRPKADCQYVFVKHCAPYGIISSSFQREIVRVVRKAGISTPADKPVGMHTFRRSLATSLIKQGFDVSEVAQMLTHNDPRVTQQYVALDIDQLRECALEVE